MDDALRDRIEKRFQTMTPEDWNTVRESVLKDPGLREEQRKMEASQLTGCPIYSGYGLRLPG